jgi:hypothetical protein
MKKSNVTKNHKHKLYEEAFSLWLVLFDLENYVTTCKEAWRLRLITERAFKRQQRRYKAILN